MKRTQKKIPTNKEHKKNKHIQINSIFTELDHTYLKMEGFNTSDLPNPCPVQVFDNGTIKIKYNGKNKELW